MSEWQTIYPHRMVGAAGPAFDDYGGNFAPGLYLRNGYVITSRGCVRACPWCLAAKREGGIRELPVQDGHDVLDNSLLACSRRHVDRVLNMLERQPRPARFTGGLDARLLVGMPDVAARIARGRLDVAYLAYDSPAAWLTTERAVKMLLDAGGWAAGQGRRKVGVYVLAGFDPEDTETAVVDRAGQVVEAGATPFLMVYRPAGPAKDPRMEALKRSLRRWMRPSAIFAAQEMPTP
jgi:hypothetical protein